MNRGLSSCSHRSENSPSRSGLGPGSRHTWEGHLRKHDAYETNPLTADRLALAAMRSWPLSGTPAQR